jgi:3-dehydroquinate synthase
MLERACKIKADIIEIDQDDSGMRRILNFGHTPGHAIEALSGYKIPHGEGVAIGQVVMATASSSVLGFPLEDVARISDMLYEFKISISVPNGISTKEIMKKMESDKKAQDGVRFCLVKRIGEAEPFGGEFVTKIDDKIIEEAIESCRQIRTNFT